MIGISGRGHEQAHALALVIEEIIDAKIACARRGADTQEEMVRIKASERLRQRLAMIIVEQR